MKLCRSCGRPATRARQLCWRCHTDVATRERFPSTSKFSPLNRVLEEDANDFVGTPPVPEEPTDALPGSAEKIAVLRARAARRLALFHPLDATMGREQGEPVGVEPVATTTTASAANRKRGTVRTVRLASVMEAHKEGLYTR